MSAPQSVLVTRDGHLARVTIHRPDKLNALDYETIALLHRTVLDLSNDDGVGAVVLTGAGEKAFVAGADIGGLVDQGVIGGKHNARHGQAMMAAIASSTKPWIAAINGYALGGGLELALSCDVRLCAEHAKLGLPEVSLGIIPGYGGTQRLPRQIGLGNAMKMILSGDPIGAEEALRMGLVQGVFPAAELLTAADALARRMLSRGPQALAFAKQAARRGLDQPLEQGLELEADLFGAISSTDEMQEGLRAFIEKRKPNWLRT